MYSSVKQLRGISEIATTATATTTAITEITSSQKGSHPAESFKEEPFIFLTSESPIILTLMFVKITIV